MMKKMQRALCVLTVLALLLALGTAALASGGETPEEPVWDDPEETYPPSGSDPQPWDEPVEEPEPYEPPDYDGIPVSQTYFPDPVFQRYVANEIDLNRDWTLSAEECEAVQVIELTRQGVTSVEGIQYFPNLTDLDLRENALEGYDPGVNPNLVWLNVSGNYLESLDVSRCPSLQYLACYDNALTSLVLGQHPVLQYLFCSGNGLDALDLSGCPMLERLDCSSNWLSALDLSACTELLYLNCSRNALEALDLTPVPGLKGLECAHNNFWEIDLSPCPWLCYVYRFGARYEQVDDYYWYIENAPGQNAVTVFRPQNQYGEFEEIYCAYFLGLHASMGVTVAPDPTPYLATPAPTASPDPVVSAPPTPPGPTPTPPPTPSPTPGPTQVPGPSDTVSVRISEDGKGAVAEGEYQGLYVRISYFLLPSSPDNETNLYWTQGAINENGVITFPTFAVPGIKLAGVSVALVPRLQDIGTPEPEVLAADFRMFEENPVRENAYKWKNGFIEGGWLENGWIETYIDGYNAGGAWVKQAMDPQKEYADVEVYVDFDLAYSTRLYNPDYVPAPTPDAPTITTGPRPSVVIDPTGGRAKIEGKIEGLFVRVALVLDLRGVSGLYVTQAKIEDGGIVTIPTLGIPGMKVTGVNVSLVSDLRDIQSTTPKVLGTDSLMF